MEKNGIKAYLFSVGESTTELSQWALERLGFEVVLLYDPKTTLAEKYEEFIANHEGDEWVVRCDADIIVNHHFLHEVKMITQFGGGSETEGKDVWWWQFRTFCMLKQEVINGTPMLMKREVFDLAFKKKYHENCFRQETRPETALYRDPDINPHTQTRKMLECQVAGIHGYRQRAEDFERVMDMKKRRNQLHEWDLELTRRINEL